MYINQSSDNQIRVFNVCVWGGMYVYVYACAYARARARARVCKSFVINICITFNIHC